MGETLGADAGRRTTEEGLTVKQRRRRSKGRPCLYLEDYLKRVVTKVRRAERGEKSLGIEES